jgi:hypothetical protein
MFDDSDFDRYRKDNGDTVPDGIVNAEDYVDDIEFVVNQLINTDFDDFPARAISMMEVINHLHEDEENLSDDRVYGTVIGLMYHLQLVFGSMDEDYRKELFNFIKEEYIPEMRRDSKTLPYWDGEDSESYEDN